LQRRSCKKYIILKEILLWQIMKEMKENTNAVG
jgi:hypothetical protein